MDRSIPPTPPGALSPARLRQVVDSLEEGVAILDAHGVIEFINARGQEILRVPALEMLGHRLVDFRWEIIGADETPLPREDHPALKAVATGKPQARTVLGMRTPAVDGETVWVEVSATPMAPEHGDGPPGSLTTFRDVSTRVAAERALKEAAEFKDQIIGLVSHELRAPLVSILGGLSFLAPYIEGADEDGQRLYDMAVRNARLLERLVNDLLDIERLEGGQVALELQSTRLADLLEEARSLALRSAEDRGVKLEEVDVVDGEVSLDHDRILQVLTNLLSNAVKFSDPGGSVRLRGRLDEGALEVEVIDEGRGIPEDQAERVFERFVQVHPSDASDRGGAGLGLAIARAVVMRHGGRIWVEPNPGRGSCFRFRIPLAS